MDNFPHGYAGTTASAVEFTVKCRCGESLVARAQEMLTKHIQSLPTPDYCDICNAPQNVTPDGEHHCGEASLASQVPAQPPAEPDEQWLERIRTMLPDGSPVPLFHNTDGSINREKVMELPCFLSAIQRQAASVPAQGTPPAQPRDVEGLLASATDLLNSWAREMSVEQARNEDDIVRLIDRLWSELSSRLFAAPAPASPQVGETLEQEIARITCQYCRLGFELLPTGKHVTFTCGTDGIAKFRHEDAPCTSKASEIMPFIRTKLRAALAESDNLKWLPGQIATQWGDIHVLLGSKLPKGFNIGDGVEVALRAAQPTPAPKEKANGGGE